MNIDFTNQKNGPMEERIKPSIKATSSVIICSRNRPRLLLNTINSVLAGIELPNELIVMDDSNIANQDAAILMDRPECHLHYIHRNASGVSQARNEGMALATSEIIILIDDDMQVSPDWLGTLLEAVVQAGPLSIVTGRILPGYIERPDGFIPTLVQFMEPGIFEGRIGTDRLPSAHMAMYRTVFQKEGGFDERMGPGTRFQAAEDNDYGYRLLEAGYKIKYVPEAVIYHHAWRGNPDYYPLYLGYGRGQGAFYAKYLSLHDPYILFRLLKDFSKRIYKFPWRLLYNYRLAIRDIYFVYGLLSGCIEWLAMYRWK